MKFLVRLTNEFSAISGAIRHRAAGLEIPVGEGIEADLSDDQVKTLASDQYVSLKNAQGEEVAPDPQAMSRSELDAHAAAKGVEAPDKLPNKQAVLDAVAAQHAPQSDAQPSDVPAATEAPSEASEAPSEA